MTAEVKQKHLSEVLDRLSVHLDMIAGQVFDVEEAISPLLSNNIASSNPSIEKFQSLDFVRQTLEDCSLLVGILSKENSTTGVSIFDKTQITNRLKLDITRELLTDNVPSIRFESGGDIEFF